MMKLPGTFDRLHFGTAGVPADEGTPLAEGLELLRRHHLTALELEFVQRVYMNDEEAREAGAMARERGVLLSAHAPYYINLASLERPKYHASVSRIVKTAQVLHAAGGHSVVFHAAFYQERKPEKVYKQVAAGLAEIEEALRKKDVAVWLRPELTGKPTQFGDVSELTRLSREFETVLPCIDFSHLHARTAGEYNTEREWDEVMQQLATEIPAEKQPLRRMHIHLSGIAYGPKGERNHLPLAESDLNYAALLAVLKRHGVCGTVICEGPHETVLDDLALMRKAYGED